MGRTQHAPGRGQRVAARGLDSRSETLASHCITKTTRVALRLPTPLPEPFHGILPQPSPVLATRSEPLAKVTTQFHSQTAARDIPMNHAFVTERCAHDAWWPLQHLPAKLPLPLLQDLLRARARPANPASVSTYACSKLAPPHSSPPHPSLFDAKANPPSLLRATTSPVWSYSALAGASTLGSSMMPSNSRPAPPPPPTRLSATASTRASPPSLFPSTRASFERGGGGGVGVLRGEGVGGFGQSTPPPLSLRTKMYHSRFFSFWCWGFVVKTDHSFLEGCC